MFPRGIDSLNRRTHRCIRAVRTSCWPKWDHPSPSYVPWYLPLASVWRTLFTSRYIPLQLCTAGLMIIVLFGQFYCAIDIHRCWVKRVLGCDVWDYYYSPVVGRDSGWLPWEYLERQHMGRQCLDTISVFRSEDRQLPELLKHYMLFLFYFMLYIIYFRFWPPNSLRFYLWNIFLLPSYRD